ncbi:LIC10604 family protein [Leptospira idonii]|uniref:SRPBCC family protein n=1 Tax=Leptospira idonii TaxID=1193500 RepID=A0A4R9LZX5_9LEPT|nr:SRPBCC family protein [Leptospira idonii]TGN19211.1 SRPBCC family protein [Leptospira idonii]
MQSLFNSSSVGEESSALFAIRMKQWFRILLSVFLAFSLLIGVVYAVGSGLPQAHTVSLSTELPLTPDKLYPKLRNFREFPSWQKNLESVEPVSEISWKEKDTSGDTITYAIVKEEPNRMFETKIMDEDLPFGGSWTFEISETKDGSRLTITENGYVYSPIFRFVAHYVMGNDSSIKTYLEYLNSALNREKVSK